MYMEQNKSLGYEEEDNEINLIWLANQMVIWGIHFWKIAVALIILFCSILAIFSYASINKTYIAYTTCSVKDTVDSEQNTNTMELSGQVSLTFTHMISSGLFDEWIVDELGPEASNAVITAKAIMNTNMVTIQVEDEDRQRAFQIIEVIKENYGEIMDYILGPTELEVVHESGIPLEKQFGIGNLIKAMILGIGLGIILYLVGILIFVIRRKTVQDYTDITQIIDVNYWGNIPKIKEKKQAVLLNKKNVATSMKEKMNMFATKVELNKKLNQQSVYAVTSAIADEGKSVFATNLAINLAQKKNKVLLIDGNIRKTSLQNAFGLQFKKSIYHVLIGEQTLQQVVCSNSKNSLHILPAAEPNVNVELTSVFLEERVKRLLEEAIAKYDYVIIDTPPAKLCAETSTLVRNADATIFMVKQDHVLLEDAIDTLENFIEEKVQIIGLVLNGKRHDYSTSSNGYGYGYGYGYAYHDHEISES